MSFGMFGDQRRLIQLTAAAIILLDLSSLRHNRLGTLFKHL